MDIPEFIVNEENVIPDDSYKHVRKSRIVLENPSGGVIICRSKGKVSFPGGKLDKDESFLEGAVRELREETGISLPESDLEPLCRVVSILGNHQYNPQGDKGRRIHEVVFFMATTEKPIAPSDMELTAWEKVWGFSSEFVPREALVAEMRVDHSEAVNGHNADLENLAVLSALGWV